MEIKKELKPDALIFDMDGTLWDAVETYAKAWNKFFENQGISKTLSKSELDALMGLEEAHFLEKVLPEFRPEVRKKHYEKVIQIQYDLIDDIGGEIYPGVLKFLEKLKVQYKLFIVSNCPKYTIKHFMKFAQIEHLITGTLSHGQNYNPKHKNIRELIDTYGLKKAIYVGDTHGDMIQSKKANIPFVFMSYGFGNSDSFHKSFDSFEEFALFYLND